MRFLTDIGPFRGYFRWLRLISLLLMLTLLPLREAGAALITAPHQPLTQPGPEPRAEATRGAGGASMYLNGASYVTIPHASLPALSDLTLETWIYPTSTTGCKAFFGTDYTLGLWFGMCSARLRMHYGGSLASDGPTPLLANTWTHVAATVLNLGANRTITFYINGEYENSYSISSAITLGGTRDLHLGHDQIWDYFYGDLTEARLWDKALSQNQIRRNMHVSLEAPLDGLAASWRLTGDALDRVGGLNGTLVGAPVFTGFPSPAVPATTPIDRYFNVLPESTNAHASAAIPYLDAAVLVGGVRSEVPSAQITRVNGGDGSSTTLTPLPEARTYGAAAFAPSTGKVYMFGGGTNKGGTTTTNTIFVIDPLTGYESTLATTLPANNAFSTAVYDGGIDRIILMGGWNGTLHNNKIILFNPHTGAVLQAAPTLPSPRFGVMAAYIPLLGKTMVAGGGDSAFIYTNVDLLDLEIDGSGSLSPTGVDLPLGDATMATVFDPITNMVYMMNGFANRKVLAYDPLENQLWETMVEMPFVDGSYLNRPYSSAFYSPIHRHALILGGGLYFSGGSTSVWRVPLGDGPLVELGRWDFESFGSTVTAISGGNHEVAIGGTFGLYMIDGEPATPDYQWHSTGSLGGAVQQLFYDGKDDVLYVSAGNRASLITDGSPTAVPSFTAPYGSVKFTHPYKNMPPLVGINAIFGHSGGGNPLWAAKWDLAGLNYYGYLGQCSEVMAILDPDGIPGGEYWALERFGACPITRENPGSTLDRQPDVFSPVYLKKITQDIFGNTTGSYGGICNPAVTYPQHMVRGLNGDLWVGGIGYVCRYPSTSLPSSGAPSYNSFNIPTGTRVNGLSVDADGRVWMAVSDDDLLNSGSLTAFEAVRSGTGSTSAVRAQDFNWLNAPVGGNARRGSSYWDSAMAAVGAVGERVWAGRDDTIYTFAPRWQQFDQAQNLESVTIEKIWTARGRLFAASDNTLYVLQPDGNTWENWGAQGVSAVLPDQNGRIWLALDHGDGSGGLQFYDQDGWLPVPGQTLNEPVTALTEDPQGRIWLGLAGALGLYDRERLVTRLALPTVGQAVSTLLADPAGNIWVGTDNGLARWNATDASWSLFTTAEGLPSSSIADLAYAQDLVFASTSSGLAYFDPDTGLFAPQGYDGLVDENLPLTNDQDDRLWAGPGRLDPDGWQIYSWANSGVRQSTTTAAAADQADRVWFAHPDGGLSVRGAFLPPLADEVPIIDSFSPTSGSASTEVVILGSGFGSDKSDLQVTVGGAPVFVRAVTPTQIDIVIARDTLSGELIVRRGKRLAAAPTPFCAIPIELTALREGITGTKMHIQGTNFDPDVTVQYGSGTPRKPDAYSPTELWSFLRPTDTSGTLVITNHCPGQIETTTGIRKVEISLHNLGINQGYSGMPLVALRPSVVHANVVLSEPILGINTLRFSEIKVNAARLAGNDGFSAKKDWSKLAIPSSVGTPGPLIPEQLVFVPNLKAYEGQNAVTMAIYNNGFLVASATTRINFERNYPARVLLVPMLSINYTQGELNALKKGTEAELYHFSERLMPLGAVEYAWSNEVYTLEYVFDAGSGEHIRGAAPRFDEIRANHNRTATKPYQVVIGIFPPSLNSSQYYAGLAMDQRSIAKRNSLEPDERCDGNVIEDIALWAGLADCKETPIFIAWSVGGENSAKTIAHELGHLMDLVDANARNHADDNSGHSEVDELFGGECGDPGALYATSQTLYRQLGVSEPVYEVYSGDWYPPYLFEVKGDPADQNTGRAKAIMSYACGGGTANSFFEPYDFLWVRQEMTGFLRPVFDGRTAAVQRAPALPIGERIRITGYVSEGLPITGTIANVMAVGPDALLSAAYASEYAVVQYDAANTPLADHAVVAVFDTVDGDPADSSGNGVFGLTFVLSPTTAYLTLEHKGSVLDTFSAGPASPVVTVTEIAGYEPIEIYLPPIVQLGWDVSDGDGDRLTLYIDYSQDDGANWLPIAITHTLPGTGAIAIDATALPGSPAARFRITASDGLHTSESVSEGFAVTAKNPLVWISEPFTGTIFLEGETVTLLGGGSDPQDGPLTHTLTWESSLDGLIGYGDELTPTLSVGEHTILLSTLNSAWLYDSAQITLTVLADYDGDGIGDTEEESRGLNPITALDVMTDTDGDGLNLATELARGTNPDLPDTDGDGRNDAEEILDLTNPNVPDSPVLTHTLAASPESISETITLNNAGYLPYAPLAIISSAPVTYVLTASQPWLEFLNPTATTPSGATAIFNPILLSEGGNTATITITASGYPTISIPVFLKVIGMGQYCDTNRDGLINNDDVDDMQARVGAVYGDANYQISYDVDRDGDIDTADVAQVTSCIQTNGPTQVPTATNTPSPTPTSSPTGSATPTATATPSPSPTNSATSSPTSSATATASPTATPSPTPTQDAPAPYRVYLPLIMNRSAGIEVRSAISPTIWEVIWSWLTGF